MPDSQDHVRFEQLVLPDRDAAYNLARWLLRSLADAEDLTQEAMLRSYKFFSSSRVGDARLASPDRAQQGYPSMAKNPREENMTEFDEEFHGPAGPTPEEAAISSQDRAGLTRAVEPLAEPYFAVEPFPYGVIRPWRRYRKAMSD